LIGVSDQLQRRQRAALGEPMNNADCSDLLEEARALLLCVPLDVQKSTVLISKLLWSAAEASKAGDTANDSALRKAAADLERQLAV
jgi:hypothetical protein